MSLVDESLSAGLKRLSESIHSLRELAYEEYGSVEAIDAFLRSEGHATRVGVGGIRTAFEVLVGPSSPTVAILAEYDALPEVGHGCGHNLIAMTTVGAFVAAARSWASADVGLRLIGTPAEEGGGGKIRLLEQGVFEGVAAVISSHPAAESVWAAGATNLGVVGHEVVFKGLATHASSAPQAGRNALSALLLAFAGIDAARQRLGPDDRITGIITDGGSAVNVIPARAAGRFGIRSRSAARIEELVALFEGIVRGAALQTQTDVETSETMRLHLPMTPAPWISESMRRRLRESGIPPVLDHHVWASTDLGNVSAVIDTDWLRFPVTEQPIPGHSLAMAEASLSGLAHANGFVATEILAGTLLDLAASPSVKGWSGSRP